MRPERSKTSRAEYSVWESMKARCSNPKLLAYQSYGARGITVCQRWAESFEAFFADMGPRPDGYWIERIDNDRGYEPGNCKWVTPKVQAANRRAWGTAWKTNGPLAPVIEPTPAQLRRMQRAQEKLKARGLD